MGVIDNRSNAGSGAAIVTSVNGHTGIVTITSTSLGAKDAPVSQGSAAFPVLIDNLDVITLSTTKDEVLYLAGDGADQTIDLTNFSGLKPSMYYLKIVVSGAYALLVQPGGNFVMNGERRCVAGSILNFFSNGTQYIEDGSNEIA